jgi:hypothetical protein|eukprot:COSAG01_NODE_1605_length_9753_cov_46.460798_7_plen_99_part_00
MKPGSCELPFLVYFICLPCTGHVTCRPAAAAGSAAVDALRVATAGSSSLRTILKMVKFGVVDNGLLVVMMMAGVNLDEWIGLLAHPAAAASTLAPCAM